MRKPLLTLAVLFLVGSFASARPQILQEQKLTATGGALLDTFGRDVSLDGSTAVIGAAGDDDMGSATFYEEVGGTWVEGQKITASNAAAGARFGFSVVLSRDTALVGANGEDEQANDAGAVYVFRKNAGTWSETEKLFASDPAEFDNFGHSLDAEGDVLVVGAANKTEAGFGASGAAYVFRRAGTVGTEEQKLTGATGFAYLYGQAVATDGEVVVVGAPGEDSPANSAGAVYVYRHDGSTWQLDDKVLASDGAADDNFGWSVGVEGDLVVAGAFWHTVVDHGAAYLLRWNGTGWAEEQKLSGAQPGDWFGYSADIDSGRVVVGAVGWPAGGGRGAVYQYVHDGATWTQAFHWTSSDASAGFFFADLGFAVSLDGSTLMAGAPWADGAETNAGAAYVFESCGVTTNYCTPGTSASGCQAVLSTAGTPSATATSGFDLIAANVEGAENGLYYYGASGRQANPWGNGTSYQCVVPPVKRAGLLVGVGTSGLCDGSFTQDLNARWCPSCSKPNHNPGEGAVVQAQLWYRDPHNTSSQTTSLSNAVEFVLCP